MQHSALGQEETLVHQQSCCGLGEAERWQALREPARAPVAALPTAQLRPTAEHTLHPQPLPTQRIALTDLYPQNVNRSISAGSPCQLCSSCTMSRNRVPPSQQASTAQPATGSRGVPKICGAVCGGAGLATMNRGRSEGEFWG